MSESIIRKESNFSTTEAELVWKINNFLFLKNEDSIKSPVYIVGEKNPTKWQLEVYPNGDEKENENYISLFICLCKGSAKEVFAKFGFYILDCKKEKRNVMNTLCPDKFSPSSNSWGWARYLATSEIKKKENSPGGTVTFGCKIEVYDNTQIDKIQSTIDEKKQNSSILTNLWNARIAGEFTDVELKIGDESIPCHKVVLATKSAMMKAMFQNNMLENETKQVFVNEFSFDCMFKVVEFIYKGEASAIGPIVTELYNAADYYDVPDLKSSCESYMLSNITRENVLDILVVAHKCRGGHLMDEGVEFLTENEQVLESPEYKKLVERNDSNFSICIMKKLAQKFKKAKYT